MKNYLMFALLIGAASTVAFGQTVTCDGCTHDVSVYMGEGGLIAESDADEVVWVTTCDGVTVSGELTPNDDGKVSMLFDDMNGLACHSDKGSLQLGPIMDGGWYWITDGMNSAVGGLVDQDVIEALKDMTTDPTDAGAGVTMTAGKGAVYLKETATGRVGILPTNLPEIPKDDPTLCGPARKKCMLGDGGTKIVATGPLDSAGNRTAIADGGTVTRPAGAGSFGLEFRLLGNGTGHYSTASATPDLGLKATAPLAATFSGAHASPGGSGDADANGLALTSASNVGTLSISADSTGGGALCPTTKGTARYTAKVTITARVAADDLAQIVPAIPANAKSDANLDDNDVHDATFTVNVACPAAASSSPHQGVELIPENAFPTDR